MKVTSQEFLCHSILNKFIEMYITKQIRREILEIKPCLFPNAFPKIFSWDELQRLINLRPFVNNKRFKIIESKGYNWDHQAWLSDMNTFPPSLLETELRKYHCYFSDSSRVNEQINQICNELENTFANSAVDAHIYFTIADNLNGGFGIHWDYSHNLIVQVEGNTRFLLWNHYADNSVTDRVTESLPVDPLYDVILNPGDAIFVPLRSYHRALSQTKRLSVSFPISFGNDAPSQDRHWVKL